MQKKLQLTFDPSLTLTKKLINVVESVRLKLQVGLSNFYGPKARSFLFISNETVLKILLKKKCNDFYDFISNCFSDKEL